MLAIAPADERALAGAPGMSVGILSAIQGTYSSEQMMLDVGQGARVATSAYDSPRPPLDRRLAGGARRARGRAADCCARACSASSVPGGAGYVGVERAAGGSADPSPRRSSAAGSAALSFGRAATLLARIAAIRARRQFVVADLPGGAAGSSDLHALAATRPAGELLIVVQRAALTKHGHELLWVGVAGLRGRRRPSADARARRTSAGWSSAIDLAPTILAQLGLPVPAQMRGEPIETDGTLDSRRAARR